ncbi:armadillo repeat-containing protein 6 isoform X4 [Artibeus jamaicensis]|uniref:armadillo repeat-containing protein 6 isoform X4 n=1 Tax=Artibeus jamaicensis TaxID=9417 RepID=UPI00235ADDF5|nr:armadillo repeat-containing protein 6 isoform X4 [Artibeus jamaicensis]
MYGSRKGPEAVPRVTDDSLTFSHVAANTGSGASVGCLQPHEEGMKMASKRITQETFDAAVRENIEEFEMGPEEAVKEAVEQFESQGVELSNIIKMAPKVSEDGPQELTHDILQVLNALSALIDGQPDLLDTQGLKLLVATLAQNGDSTDLICTGIRCIRHACLKHEQNRQNLVKAGVLPLLTGAITRHSHCADVVREACWGLRIMTFDDDIRVPFGHAHDHAKMIVQENKGLKVLIEAAKAFPDNPSILSELCSTLSRLAVRNEFCQEVVDLGGLGILMALLADCIDHQELVKQVLSALRAIAGNDDVKDAIVRAGGTECIVAAMTRHLASPQVCEQSCAALCVLALRKPENSQVIVEGGGALAALEAMKAHPKEAGVQKQACMLIRNLVARSQAFSQLILDLGAEALIVQARVAHQDCEDVAKAALRDLGCRVELRELWTGQKGNLAP